MELDNADTGSLLCHSVSIRGKSDELYDERGLRRAWLLVHPSLPLGRSDDRVDSTRASLARYHTA